MDIRFFFFFLEWKSIFYLSFINLQFTIFFLRKLFWTLESLNNIFLLNNEENESMKTKITLTKCQMP